MQIRKAERKKAKLRVWLSGPSWSGKTYSALEMAFWMTQDWSKITLIDSENGSGELYSDLWAYNILTLDAPYTPERYIEAIKACEDIWSEVIIIDSTSHEWDGRGWCLELNEKLAWAKFKGNTWAAWSETTPRHQKFIEAIVTSKCHIITTARSKTDTIQTEDKKIKKVGTKEIQREGFEYELTANFNIDRDHHLAIASKDRTGLFIDRDPFLINADIGKEIMTWNQSGIDGEALEAERKVQEEKERVEREERESQEREDLYNSLIAEMQSVKFIDDLASIWNTQVQPNKSLLWEAYIKDLTERKDAIKEQLAKAPVKPAEVCTPAPEPKKPAAPKAPPAPPKKEPEAPVEPATPPAPVKTPEEVKPAEAPLIPEELVTPVVKDPAAQKFDAFITKIKATKNIEELNDIWLEVETALWMREIELFQHGVLASHKWIMLKKFPTI